jgi:hypothetical protein
MNMEGFRDAQPLIPIVVERFAASLMTAEKASSSIFRVMYGIFQNSVITYPSSEGKFQII